MNMAIYPPGLGLLLTFVEYWSCAIRKTGTLIAEWSRAGAGPALASGNG